MILLASATTMSAPDIARLYRTDESYVRKVIHAFNDEGFDSLRPRYRGGRPKKTTPAERDRVVAIARTAPTIRVSRSRAGRCPRLAERVEAQLGLALCPETLRALLRDAGLSHQRTRSWKWSPDPDFQAKAEHVLGLYRQRPADGPVVCFDEMGPIQLIPRPGSGWAPTKRPERLRATYKRPHGVRYLFGASQGGGEWHTGDTAWVRDPTYPTSHAVPLALTPPDASGRIWVSYSNLMGCPNAICNFQLQLARPVPGRPAVSPGVAAAGPHVSWSPEEVDSASTYTLEHADAYATWTTVAAGLSTPSYAFSTTNPESQGTWTYRAPTITSVAPVNGRRSPRQPSSTALRRTRRMCF